MTYTLIATVQTAGESFAYPAITGISEDKINDFRVAKRASLADRFPAGSTIDVQVFVDQD